VADVAGLDATEPIGRAGEKVCVRGWPDWNSTVSHHTRAKTLRQNPYLCPDILADTPLQGRRKRCSMDTFEKFKLNKPLQNALNDLGFVQPTPIQDAAFSVVLSGKNVVGIAQTGTGKTLAYLLPLLQDYKYSKELHPRILILVPTRELVDQVVEQVTHLTRYMNLRILGIYGGSNINTQKQMVAEHGANILVATPQRLYDIVSHQAIKLSEIKKLVIDEVDVMLDLGFRHQLSRLFELMPKRRQNIMFDELIDEYFIQPERITIEVSGTPLDNIAQLCYPVKNFYTKANLLIHLLDDAPEFKKVLVFVSSKRVADRLYTLLENYFGMEIGVIHADKSQNLRITTVDRFDRGLIRVLVTTDVMARGLDLDQVSHVVQIDTPIFPENYMHRIGRTGRAASQGTAILFFTEEEVEAKAAIEALMNYQIPQLEFPEAVELSRELAPEERPAAPGMSSSPHAKKGETRGPAFHEKKDKNKKVNLGGRKRQRELALKYNKPKSRGDMFAPAKKKR
jgi:ATP-dependent RNA helicase RhlE